MSTIPMICPRDYTLRTRTGHTIRFEAGVPSPVPESAYQEALAKNIIPVERPSDDNNAFGMVHADITGTLRDAIIYQAIETLVHRNNAEDFGGGKPKATAMSIETGLSLSASEVGKYWNNYKQLVAENEALPTHPRVEVVRELQACATRKQLTEFAEEHGINMPKAQGKTVKELKELLLNAVVNQQQVAPAADEYVKPATLTHD